MGLNKQTGNMYPFVTHTWNPIRGKCPHDCLYCLTGDAKVLMTDLSLKAIGDLSMGDRVIGFDTSNGRYGFLRETTVEAIKVSSGLAHRIITEDTEIQCSSSHRWLTNHNRWRSIDYHLHIGSRIKRIFNWSPESYCPSEDYMRGYLRGIIFGDGTMGTYKSKGQSVVRNGRIYRYSPTDIYKFRLSMKDEVAIRRAELYLSSFNIRTYDHIHSGLPSIRKDGKNSYYSLLQLTAFRDSLEFRRGYLAGIFEAEGSFSQGILRISNKDIRELTEDLSYFGFNFHIRKQQNAVMVITLRGGLSEQIRFLNLTRPSITRKTQGYKTHPKSGGSKILSIETAGKQELYDIQTGTGNFIANGLVSHNCYMKVYPQPELHFAQKELGTNLGQGNFIFVGSSTDMWCKEVWDGWLAWTLGHCHQFANRYLFQSKNPARFLYSVDLFPPSTILGVTIETDAYSPHPFSKAPAPLDRVLPMVKLRNKGIPRMVSIEPIMDFDPKIMIELINTIRPEFVSVGADSKGHNLPEPNRLKTKELLNSLECITKVYVKDNLNRILGQEIPTR